MNSAVPARRRWGSSRSALLSLVLHVAAALVVGGAQGIALVGFRTAPEERPLELALAPPRPLEALVAEEPPAPIDLEEATVLDDETELAPAEPPEEAATSPLLGVPEADDAASSELAAIALPRALDCAFDPRSPRVHATIGAGRGERGGVAARGTTGGDGSGSDADRRGVVFGVLGGNGTTAAPPRDPPPVVRRVAPDYPKEARRLGLEGVVTVVAVLRADGSIESLEVEASSGCDALDRAALDCVRENWTFSALAEPSSGRRRRVEIPIRFQLRHA